MTRGRRALVDRLELAVHEVGLEVDDVALADMLREVARRLEGRPARVPWWARLWTPRP